ncbi:hypothetical protein RCL1_001771 [Eukaryota sp. TZLM3-RCL]
MQTVEGGSILSHMRSHLLFICLASLIAVAYSWGFPQYKHAFHGGMNGLDQCIPGCESQIIDVQNATNSAVQPLEADILVACNDPLLMNISVTVPTEPFDAFPDVMLSIDLTDSFGPSLPLIQQLIIDAADIVAAQFPNFRFGVSSYMDKLHQPFGAPTDTTFELHAPVTSDRNTWVNAILGLQVGSGGDLPEAQLTAMQRIARFANDFGFAPFQNTSQSRTMIVVTDAPYHEFPNCLTLQANPICTQPNDGSGVIDPTMDYPTVDQVREALLDANIQPLFLVEPPVFAIYEDLVNELGFGEAYPVTEFTPPDEVAQLVIDFIPTFVAQPSTVHLEVGAPTDLVTIQPTSFANVTPGDTVVFNVTFFTLRCNPFISQELFYMSGLATNQMMAQFQQNGFNNNGMLPTELVKIHAFIEGQQFGTTRFNVALCPCVGDRKKKGKCCGGCCNTAVAVSTGGGSGCGCKKKKRRMYPRPPFMNDDDDNDFDNDDD